MDIDDEPFIDDERRLSDDVDSFLRKVISSILIKGGFIRSGKLKPDLDYKQYADLEVWQNYR